MGSEDNDNSSSVSAVSVNAVAPLVKGCALLTLVVLLLAPAVAWYGHANHGTDGLLAAAVALGVCWVGAIAALAVTAFSRGPSGAVQGVLLGMLFRMGLPLGSLMLLQERGGALVDAEVLGMILACYFVTLVAETLLSLQLVKKINPPLTRSDAHGAQGTI